MKVVKKGFSSPKFIQKNKYSKDDSRSSKKYKMQDKVSKHSKEEILQNYSRHLKNSTELLKLQKRLHKTQYVRFNSQDDSKLWTFFTKMLRVSLEETYLPHCYKVKKSFFSLSGSLPVLSGQAYLQDISSQLPLNLFDFSMYKGQNMKILDLCSSPGSKTTQLLSILENYNIDATIYANELQQTRVKRLVNNVQKHRMKNVVFTCVDGLKFDHDEEFDLVLLDAPCSGNLILEKDWLEKRNRKGILKNARTQKLLLEKCKKLCKKNGYIIYSTCSMEIEENEENVLFAQKELGLKTVSFIDKLDWKFLFEYRSVEILKNCKDKKMLENCVRIHPPYSMSQGFFITIFKK